MFLGIDDCGVWVVYLIMVLFCIGVFFLNFMFISCERYVVIFLLLSYMWFVIKFCVLSIIGGVWLVWVILICV